MIAARAAAIVVVALAGAAGCNPLVLLSESGTFGGAARSQLAQDCCACLVRAELRDYDVGCPIGPDEDAGELVVVDAGEAPGDGGAPIEEEDAGPPPTPCLCEGIDEAVCVARLLEREDAPIVVVGACVRRDVENIGPCGSACGGVLAYPDEAAATAASP